MIASSRSADRDTRWVRVAIAAIIAGAIFRLVWTLWIHPPVDYLFSDMEGYVRRARTLANGGPFTRFYTFYQPGAQMLLAIPLRIFGLGRSGLWAGAVVWALFSCLVPLVSWLWLKRFMSARASAIAAVLVAASPIYITYGGFFLSEIPAVLFLVLTLYLVDRAGEAGGRSGTALAAAAGVSAALAIAVRHQLILNVLIAAWVLLFVHRNRRAAAVALVGLAVPLAGLVVFNTSAAGKFVGLSEVGGLNFFLGHCPVHTVNTNLPGTGFFRFASPVVVQQKRGLDYTFPNHIAWEQSYFIKQGLRCIKDDGIAHVGVLIKNTADLGLTSVPWPQSTEPGLRRVVGPSNAVYILLLPIMVAGAVLLIRRGSPTGINGPGILLVHLAAMVPFALLFFGDPRYRMSYDVFGLALLAAVIDHGRRIVREPSGER